MKVVVKVEGSTFEVEVGELTERPIIAVVEGERFEVWPEIEASTAAAPAPSATSTPVTSLSRVQSEVRPTRRTSPMGMAEAGEVRKTVYAPIPGVLHSVSVQPGDQVEVGQELCILEAMKMKNIIRAPRAGEIARVLVTPGQHVKHHDPMIEYRD